MLENPEQAWVVVPQAFVSGTQTLTSKSNKWKRFSVLMCGSFLMCCDSQRNSLLSIVCVAGERKNSTYCRDHPKQRVHVLFWFGLLLLQIRIQNTEAVTPSNAEGASGWALPEISIPCWNCFNCEFTLRHFPPKTLSCLALLKSPKSEFHSFGNANTKTTAWRMSTTWQQTPACHLEYLDDSTQAQENCQRRLPRASTIAKHIRAIVKTQHDCSFQCNVIND